MTFNYVDDVIYKNLSPAELANKIDKYINKMIEPNKEKYVELSNNIYLAMFILLENAVKHSILDNEINIYFDETDTCLEVTIENTGARIEEYELEKLAIRGYRGKNNTTKVTGVGLSLAKEIFEQHNYPFEIKININLCLFLP